MRPGDLEDVLKTITIFVVMLGLALIMLAWLAKVVLL